MLHDYVPSFVLLIPAIIYMDLSGLLHGIWYSGDCPSPIIPIMKDMGIISGYQTEQIAIKLAVS